VAACAVRVVAPDRQRSRLRLASTCSFTCNLNVRPQLLRSCLNGYHSGEIKLSWISIGEIGKPIVKQKVFLGLTWASLIIPEKGQMQVPQVFFQHNPISFYLEKPSFLKIYVNLSCLELRITYFEFIKNKKLHET